MPRITYKRIIIRQFERFLIAASLLELILDSDTDDSNGLDFKLVDWQLKFEPEDGENEHLALLEMIEFCETVYLVLLSTRFLAYFFESPFPPPNHPPSSPTQTDHSAVQLWGMPS